MLTLSIVIPCYNEAEVLPETIKRLIHLLSRLASDGRTSPESEIVFVDDGSSDETWADRRRWQ